MRRPKCDNCGRKIRLISKPWIRDDDVFGEMPTHCPHCGEKISDQKLRELDDYTGFLCLLRCCIPCLFIIIILIVVFTMV